MTTSGASTPPTTPPNPSIVLLGRPCANTAAVATMLHDAGVELTAMVLATAEALPAALSEEHDRTRVLPVASPRAARLLLEDLRPDLVIAACYPWRLSRAARAASRRGVLNIHPSMLPHGRGPDPVFWVYRLGERQTGVTVHLMDDGLDSGPILAQEQITVPEEMDAVSLERHLFEIGAGLTAELAPRVLSGTATSSPQDEGAASYQPAPAAQDWLISPLLPAAWAWRFVRGVEPLHGPLAVQVRGSSVPVRRVIAWAEQGDPPLETPPGTIAVQFRPGWVLFER